MAYDSMIPCRLSPSGGCWVLGARALTSLLLTTQNSTQTRLSLSRPLSLSPPFTSSRPRAKLLGRGCGGGFGRGRRRLSSSGGRARSAAAVGCGCVRCEVCGGCRHGCFCRLGSTRQVCRHSFVGRSSGLRDKRRRRRRCRRSSGRSSRRDFERGFERGRGSRRGFERARPRGVAQPCRSQGTMEQYRTPICQYIRICPCMSQ